MTKAAEIGTTSRGGDFQVMDTAWDHNGSMRVTIRDNRGTGNSATVSTDTRSMRDLARRALSHPDKTRRSPVARRFVADGCHYVTFTVSRLEDIR